MTYFQVFIDTTEITDLVIEISGIQSSLDVSVPNSFQRPSVRLTIRDDGSYNPHAENNSFTSAGHNANGYLAPMTIKMVQDGIDILVFEALIDTVNQSIKPGTIDITFSDDSIRLRKDSIEDFGIDRYATLLKGEYRLNGEYPFPEAFAPISDESFSSSDVTLVDVLKTEGSLNATNAIVNENALLTEGDYLSSDPEVEFKSVYRWRSVKYLVSDIIAEYNITQTDVSVDDVDLETNIPSTMGRPGFAIENTQSADISTNFKWTGYVTDWLVDGDDFYFLYSARGHIPRILKYDTINDVWSIVVTRSSMAEWWRFVKVGDDFYILGTTGLNNPAEPVLGVYDPTETNPTPLIERLSGLTLSTYVAPTTTYKPIGAAMFYHFGFEPNQKYRTGIRPDTRRGFQVYNNELYYLYANSSGFGIAKVAVAQPNPTPAVVVSIANAGEYSHLSADFTIDGSTLYGGCCRQITNKSQLQIFKKAL